MTTINKPARKARIAAKPVALAIACKAVTTAFAHGAKADSEAERSLTYALANLKPGSADYKERFNAIRKSAIIGTMAYLLAGNKDEAAAISAATTAFDRKILIAKGDKANAGKKGVRTQVQQTAFDNGSKRFQRACKSAGVVSPNHGRKEGSKTKPTKSAASAPKKVEVPLEAWNKLQPPANADHDLALTWIKEQANRLQVQIEAWKQRGAKTGKTIATLGMEQAIVDFRKAVADLV